MARYVIYVPGLGDKRSFGQNIAIQYWRLFGLRPVYFPLNWHKPEGFEIKLQRLLKKCKELNHANKGVTIVGISAGASAAVNAFAKSNDINSVVLICGKINNPNTIGQKIYDINPDFRQSVFGVKRSLEKLSTSDRSRIMSIHPWADQTVPINDAIIDGAKEKVLPGWDHISGIFFGVILGAPSIARFIKKTGKK